jgi:PAS domain S-box-containing protein
MTNINNNNTKILIISNDEDAYLIGESLKIANQQYSKMLSQDSKLSQDNKILPQENIPQFDIIHESSLELALKRLNNNAFDSIILDANLLDKGGLEILKNIAKKFPDTSIVTLLTDIKNKDIATGAVQIQDYILKEDILKDTSGNIISRSLKYATELKKVADALRESERRYRHIVETVLEELWIIDKEGKTSYISDQIAQRLGYATNDIIGLPFINFIDTRDRDKAKQFFETRQRDRKVKYDFNFIKKDGSTSCLIISANSIFDKGQFLGSIGLFTDITEYRKIIDDLQKSEEFNRRIIESSNDCIEVLNTDGYILYMSKGGQKLFEIDNIKPYIDTSRIDFWEGNDKEKFVDTIKNVGKGSTGRFQGYCPTTKGTPKWWDVIITPLTDADGKIANMLSVSRDITDLKVIEDKLRDSENRFRTSIENMLDAFGIYSAIRDPTGHIVYFQIEFANDAAYNDGMMTLDDQISHEVLYDNNKIGLFDECCQVVETGSPLRKELIIYDDVCGYGPVSRIFDISMAKLFDGFVIVWHDITERRNAEEKLDMARKDLERSNKELEQFAYVASHDLQEPLRTIYGYAELLESNYKSKLDPDADDFIAYITTGAKRAQQMIDDLLALSRITTKGKEFVSTDIENVLKIVLENLHSLIDKNQAVITYDPMPTIIADDSQIIHLFQNLIDNAIKFRREDTPKIHISYKQEKDQYENNQYVFSVKDNGIGIDKKQFKKLFIIFQRLHSREEYPGTGIGLAICKKIVERHGGRIWLESDVGIGSTFYFTIPMKPTDSTIFKR